ncbi:MAG: holo-ACP synthase [Vicinamibacterales bacterium]
MVGPSHIIGVGLDIVEVARVERAVRRWGDRFVTRVFTAGEVAYCRGRPSESLSFAARFAAKEAGMKALGTGRDHEVRWTDLEVVRLAAAPELILRGEAAEIARRLGVSRAWLTLSHTRTLAVAHVILEGPGAETPRSAS